jgi:hypothetical protein
MNYLLENFNSEISHARTKKVKAGKDTEDKWDYYLNIEESELSLKSYSVGSYLLTTTWGQGPSFNLSCPIDPTTNFRSIVGCSGVALGQLLYYWRDRVFPDGQVSYTPSNFTSPISEAFYNQNYNWQAMSPSSWDSYNAWLLYHCAVSIESNFSSKLTSSVFDKMRHAFRYNFGFNVSSMTYYKSMYPVINDWYNLLKADLNAGRPILYRGDDASSGGHTWVIDGYRSDNTFHCNWGWSGNYNSTWYPLSALNTPNGNFSNDQSAMLNIYPALGDCTGNDVVCTSNTSYSITLPATGRVVWSKSSNLTQVGSNTSATYTVKAASSATSGSGTITASIYNSQNQVVITRSKTVWLGKPSAPVTIPTGNPIFTIGRGSQFTALINSSQGASPNSGSWSSTGSIVPNEYTTGKFCLFDAVSLGKGIIYVTTCNECGISAQKAIQVNVTTGGGGTLYTISPNPATSVITIEQLTTEEAATCSVLTPVSVVESSSASILGNETYTIEIWHEKKGKVKTETSNKKRISIDVSGLEKGNYFLHIITPTALYEEHILID